VERLAQAGDEIRLTQPGQRRLAFLRRERHRRRDVLRWLRQLRLCLFDREQQARNVALQEIRRQSGFLGSAFDEAAALRVAAQVHRVQVKAFALAKSQRDFQRVRAERFLQTRHAILAAFDVHEPCIAALFQRRRRGRCWLRLFFFSRRLR